MLYGTVEYGTILVDYAKTLDKGTASWRVPYLCETKA